MVQKGKVVIFWVLVSVCLFGVITTFYYNYNLHKITNLPKIENGYTDLSGFTFNKNKKVYLSGQWEFYADTLIISENIKERNPTALVNVPHDDKKSLKNLKCASYKINIKNLSSTADIIVTVPCITNNYTIYIDGKGIYFSGEVSRNNTPAKKYIKAVPLKVDGTIDCELVIEMSVNDDRALFTSPRLLEYDTYKGNRIRYMQGSSAAAGILMFAFIIYLGLTISVKRNIFSAAIPILLFMITFWTLIKGDAYSIWQIYYNMPKMSLMYHTCILVSAIKISTLYTINSILNMKTSPNVFVFFIVYYYILCTLLIFLKSADSLFNLMLYAADVYILYRLKNEVYFGKRYSIFMTAGYLILLFGLATDSAYLSGSIITDISFNYPLCVSIFVIVISILCISETAVFSGEAKNTESLKQELDISKVPMLTNQIKPHFIFNTLMSLSVVCTENPTKAKNTIVKFADFLRANIQINDKLLISFKEEIRNIENYMCVEKIRLSDMISVKYEVYVKDFLVPPLSIQTLVENAAKHAFKDGTNLIITIKTHMDKNNYYLEVEDNGIGFNKNKMTDANSTGLQNVIKRMEIVCGATITIDSKVGVGTNIKILLPKIYQN